jgi:1,4-alpha-glucan branching enzyme
MATKKQYLKSRPVCKTKFVLPQEATKAAKTVYIVGDFNDWKVNASPMKKLKNGSFTIVIDLPVGKEYQYRYLIDGTNWENDWDADKYVPNPYGDGDNSVVII